MPETSDSLTCGQKTHRDKSKQVEEEVEEEEEEEVVEEEAHPPPPPPLTYIRHMVSPAAIGTQKRPSVLRQALQTASRQQHGNNASEAVTICKEEGETGHLGQSSSLQEGFFTRDSHHFSVRRHHPKQSSTEARTQDSIPEGTSALFASGICRWPGCDAVFQHLPSFLEHLHSEHSHGDRSIAEWRIQHEKVQHMENQLILEKQKLTAMQYHLHFSEQRLTALKASEGPYSLPLFLHQPKIAQEDNLQQWGLKHLDEGYRTVGSAHLISVPSIECYKYNNIRPPHTYAFLIRWSILESPDKQRTLNEIYNWFTTMFFYFRHNTATWKNAVRHNLSLHKCFVRVEGGKGAVWTVDETEYQRRKGQKYYRDCPVKLLPAYSQYCPEKS